MMANLSRVKCGIFRSRVKGQQLIIILGFSALIDVLGSRCKAFATGNAVITSQKFFDSGLLYAVDEIRREEKKFFLCSTQKTGMYNRLNPI